MKKKSKARARTFTIAEVYGKLIKKGDKLRKHIEAGRSEYQKELDDNEAQINRLAEFQQANNGNNGGEQQPQGMQPQQQMPMGNPGMGQPQFARDGGNIPMYWHGGYHNYDQYDRNPPRKTRSRRVRNAYGMYDEPDRSDEYLSAEQIQDMEANRDTNSMNTIYRPSSTSNTWRNAPPSGIVNINYPEEEMDPNETHPIPSSPTTPSTPPTAVSKVGQGNTSDERLRNTDYATMIAKGLPIASDIYDSLQEAEYAEAQKHPYEGDILGAKVNLVDYNPQLAELRRREEITKANIPGMSGGSPNQALLATSASGLGYSEKAADLIRQNQLQNAMIKNQYDQERRGNLMALGNFDVQQNAMEAEERRIAEATGRNFRRSAIDKGAQFATVEEEKAYQMGTLEDLYANYNYNPATKKWEYKGEDNLT